MRIIGLGRYSPRAIATRFFPDGSADDTTCPQSTSQFSHSNPNASVRSPEQGSRNTSFEAFVEQSPITMLLCGESVKPGEPGLFAMPPEDGSFCDREVHD